MLVRVLTLGSRIALAGFLLVVGVGVGVAIAAPCEKPITVDKVDLIIGPYATSAILAGMGVAQRYNKIYVHHSFGMPHLAKYEMHFPTAAFGPEPQKTIPALVFDAVAATGKPPKSVAIVTSK